MNYVAFLRGINVGGRTIKMEDLRNCFEQMGFLNVSSILQSGNVLFETEKQDLQKLTSTIEEALTKRYKYSAKVMVREITQLKKLIDDYPLTTTSPEQHKYIVFLSKEIGKELLELAQPDPKVEETALGEQVIYWKVEKGMSLKSNFAILLSKTKYKDFNTVRNLNTLQKVIT